MPSKRRKLNKEAQLPTKVAVDAAGNPLPPQFDRTKASLVTLPDEIQLMIYRYLLPTRQTLKPTEWLSFRMRARPVREKGLGSAILRASKTTHRLAASVLYGENTFSFSIIGEFTHFIYKGSRSYRRLIHHLVFIKIAFSSDDYGSLIRLNATRIKDLQALPSLQTLTLKRSSHYKSTFDEERRYAQEQVANGKIGLLCSNIQGLVVTLSGEWKVHHERGYDYHSVSWETVFDAATKKVTLGPERLHRCSKCSWAQQQQANA